MYVRDRVMYAVDRDWCILYAGIKLRNAHGLAPSEDGDIRTQTDPKPLRAVILAIETVGGCVARTKGGEDPRGIPPDMSQGITTSYMYCWA